MKTQGPVGPALQSELSIKADWAVLFFNEDFKEKKSSAKPVFTPLEMNKT